MEKFGLGQPVSRLEDPKLVMGRGEYTGDLRVPGMAYAYFLRSPHAHAVIRGIDPRAARAMPGVVAVLTAEDVESDGLGILPCTAQIESRDGSGRPDTPRHVLARGKVRHVGEAVALVVAETLDTAKDAAEAIGVDYEALPAVTDPDEAAGDGSPLLYDHIPGNRIFDWEKGDEATVEAAFARAHHVTRIELVNNRIVVNTMEPRAALADYDPETGRSTLYCSTQGPHNIRGPLANAVLKIAPELLRVVTVMVGGAFGMKSQLYPEQAAITWASRKLARAVNYAPSRGEAFQSDCQGRDQIDRAELALDAEGRFLALRTRNVANLGAYVTNSGPMIPTRAMDMLGGLYRTPAIHVSVQGYVTNSVPVAAYRGAGRPEAAYLVERLVDKAAREMGLDPDEIRRRNFIGADEMPYATPMGIVYDSGNFKAVMDKAMAQADWPGFAARKAASRARGQLRGIGMATYIERCAGLGEEAAIVEFNDDDTVTLVMGTQENGQGHWTSYAQIVTDALGISTDRIRLVQGDTDRTPPGLTGGSRSLPSGGSALLGAAKKIQEKGRALAGHFLEAAIEDIEFSGGMFRVAGTDRGLTVFELARAVRGANDLPEGLPRTLDDRDQYRPPAGTFPNGCHIAEVEIDGETGETRIVSYVVVDDFGRIVNPLLLEGQVHGGIGQGVGQALLERTVYEAGSGQLVTGSFMDYAMPRADDLPSISFDTENVPCATNPLGIKGAGEAGAIGAPPAVMNAIMDALSGPGRVVDVDMPATPERIFRLVNGRAAVPAA